MVGFLSVPNLFPVVRVVGFGFCPFNVGQVATRLNLDPESQLEGEELEVYALKVRK